MRNNEHIIQNIDTIVGIIYAGAALIGDIGGPGEGDSRGPKGPWEEDPRAKGRGTLGMPRAKERGNPGSPRAKKRGGGM